MKERPRVGDIVWHARLGTETHYRVLGPAEYSHLVYVEYVEGPRTFMEDGMHPEWEAAISLIERVLPDYVLLPAGM